MSSTVGREALRDLRSDVASGAIELEVAQADFERLTYLLQGVSAAGNRTLVSLVDDLEQIRFTRLPEHQPAAFDEVLARAQAIFERWIPPTAPTRTTSIAASSAFLGITVRIGRLGSGD